MIDIIINSSLVCPLSVSHHVPRVSRERRWRIGSCREYDHLAASAVRYELLRGTRKKEAREKTHLLSIVVDAAQSVTAISS